MPLPIDVEEPVSAGTTIPTNGNGHTNGFGSVTVGEVKRQLDVEEYEEAGLSFKPLWKGSEIDRREFVRLTMQTLEEMGYSDTAQALQRESGFVLETTVVSEFRKGVLSGNWDLVERLLLQLPEEDITNIALLKFAIREQKFLEALEASEAKKALSILRNELAPLNHDSDRLHQLSSLIMCGSPEDLRTRAKWGGVNGDSRQHLLVRIQRYISPTLMLPQHRLETLLEQAKSHQRSQCPFHSGDVSISLLADCHCDPASFPSLTTHILKAHTDEIWRLEFSHNGDWLATAGRDQTAIIWNVKHGFTVEKVFREHTDPVSCLAWSPDDSILLTTAESTIKMWNTATGQCINTLSQHEYPVGALAWLPSGKGFVSGGMDSRVFLWDLSGNVTTFPSNSQSRVIDLAVTPDGQHLVTVGRSDLSSTPPASSAASFSGGRGETPAPPLPTMAGHEKKISIFDLAEKTLVMDIVQSGELTSVSISSDSRFAIVSHAPNEILYIDMLNGTILRRLQGHDQGQFVLHSCFGGVLENFIMSGSEDGQIYVWHRDTGKLVTTLSGHGEGSVNAVTWNRSHSGMFASASDDRTVRIWEVSGPVPGRGAKREGKRAMVVD